MSSLYLCINMKNANNAHYMNGIRRNHGQSVEQTQQPQSIPQATSIYLECTYKVSTSAYVFWYVQYPGKAPEMLLSSFLNEEKKGFSAEHKKSETSFHLQKDKAEVRDSGVYFCAVSDTVTQGQSPPGT
uniref:Ig-like domain-containing protein n=1 Tax=Xenopus tropicalis TaxID=8364 RepID=A0A6I8PWE8_XENTR